MGLSSICLFTIFIRLVFPFIFFNLTIANVAASSMLPLCHDDERSALLQFKESRISGDFYAWKFDCRPTMASWKPEEGNVDCCSWDGVHCNKNTGHVIKLDLSHSCLFGSINSSSSLFKLVHLEWLNLALNDFNSSEIPPEIINLSSSLKLLDLRSCGFWGKVPHSIGNFTRLQFLYLGFNNFSGDLLGSIGNLRSLEVIQISNCNFSGQITSSLRNLTQLTVLDMAQNSYSGTIEIQGKVPKWLLDPNMQNLNTLNLSHNLLTRFDQHHVVLPGSKEEPRTGCGFSKLRIIDLSNNRFTGKLPSKSFLCWNAMKIFNTSELRYLQDVLFPYGQVSSNVLGTYDYSMTMNSKGRMMTYNKIPDILTGIILSNNRFDEAIPASISNLKGLQVLNLHNNNLQGHIPSCLGNLTNLESLDLSNNKFSGRIPQQLVELTFLEFFNVSDNYLTGPIPQGKQFATFDNTSFDANSGLCGRPLSKGCESGEAPTNEDHTEGSAESLFSGASDWKIILTGYAGGLVAGLVLGFNFSTGIIGWILEKLGMQQKATRRGRRRRN
ncbi:hypothetical protein CUMW_155060 [Citrus unshiu]|uniref:Uncharacterized protein n=1 Tax=Citrus unshiu TaxID=55188 RepID=A0A2H5PPD3_CITUN|nr:hypothetical protein CUMW_155060 [Citrus unshiu]